MCFFSPFIFNVPFRRVKHTHNESQIIAGHLEDRTVCSGELLERPDPSNVGSSRQGFRGCAEGAQRPGHLRTGKDTSLCTAENLACSSTTRGLLFPLSLDSLL